MVERSAGASDRTLDLAVTFWGKKFADHFAELCLASLLANNNLPSACQSISIRLLICAPQEDFDYLRSLPLFNKVEHFVDRIELLEMPIEPEVCDRYTRMSQGHKKIVNECHASGSVGVLLAPDMICADGFLTRLLSHLEAGRMLVLAPALRFEMDAVLAELTSLEGKKSNEGVISVSNRDLARICIFSMHPEYDAFEWRARAFADHPVCLYFRVPGQGIIMHTMSWAALMIDYRSLPMVDTSVLDCSTIDADFVHQNFRSLKNAYIERDSDAIFFAPLTHRDEQYGQALRPWFEALPCIRHLSRIKAIRTALYSDLCDQTKRLLFREPVVMRYADSRENEVWYCESACLRGVAEKAIGHEPRRVEKVLLRVHALARQGIVRHAMFWLRRRFNLISAYK